LSGIAAERTVDGCVFHLAGKRWTMGFVPAA